MDGKDRYGRVIGTIFVDCLDVNLAMMKQGLAWHYVKYSDSKELARAEETARSSRKGLWGASGQIPPWEYRAKRRTPVTPPDGNLRYWLNTGSGVRHNSTCEMFQNTKRGRICGKDEGRGSGVCGSDGTLKLQWDYFNHMIIVVQIEVQLFTQVAPYGRLMREPWA